MQPLLTYTLRQGDRALILAQRLLESITHAPEIEEDMALSNLALDLIGQARALYTYAGELEGPVDGVVRDENHYAYWREQHEFLNPLLVEQPNGDFAQIIVRQFLHDAYALPYWQAMTSSTDETLAALAAKSVKETAYHLRHTRSWVVRLGDGTDESHGRAQAAVDQLWRSPASCSSTTRSRTNSRHQVWLRTPRRSSRLALARSPRRSPRRRWRCPTTA